MKKDLSTATVVVISGVVLAALVVIGLMLFKPSFGPGPEVKPVTSFGGRFGSKASGGQVAPPGTPHGATGAPAPPPGGSGGGSGSTG